MEDFPLKSMADVPKLTISDIRVRDLIEVAKAAWGDVTARKNHWRAFELLRKRSTPERHR